MANTRKLEVLITGNAKQAQKAMGDLSGAAGKSESALSKLGRAAAGLAIGAGLYSAAKDAASLAEAQSKVGAVFGDSAKDVRDFAEGAADGLGQSEEQALSAVGTFGNLLTSFGLATNKSKDMSVAMTELASDLASFNDTSVEDAIEALRSGLSGETEPLKRYGIALDDASLKAAALAQGIYDGVGVLKPAAKAQAAYTLIMERSTNAQGDFARTSGSASNQVKIAEANYKDAKAALGESLLPVMTKAAGVASDLARAFQAIPTPVVTSALALGGLAYAAPKVLSIGTAAVDTGRKLATLAQNAIVPKSAIEGLGTSTVTTTGSLSKFTRGLGVAAAGAGAFAVTLEVLNEMSDFDGSIEDLTTDLENFGKGATDVETAVGQTGRSVDELAGAFRLNAAKADSYFGGFKKFATEGGIAGALDTRKAASDLGAIDDALAGMVKSGNADAAKDAYGRLSLAMIEAGVPAEDIASAMNDYFDQLDRAGESDAAASISGVGDASEDAAGSTGDAASAAETYADKLADIKKQADDATSAIEEFFGAQTDSTGSKIEAERALDDLSQSIRDNGLALSISGEQGRQNREAMIAARDAALDYAMSVREQTGSSTEAAAAMHQYAGSLRQTLLDAGFTETQVNSLIAEMGLTPKDINTTFHENATAAELRTKAFNDELNRITPRTTTDVVVNTSAALASIAEVRNQLSSLGTSVAAGTAGRAMQESARHYASGGRPGKGEIHWVGEDGPELRIGDGASTIIPANLSAQMMSGRSPGGRAVSSAGGSVQVVVNVAGTVQTERDLTQTIIDGINRSSALRLGTTLQGQGVLP